MVVAFWLTTLLLRQWHGIASRSRTASPPWRLRRFPSLPRNRLIRLGRWDGRGLLAHDAARQWHGLASRSRAASPSLCGCRSAWQPLPRSHLTSSPLGRVEVGAMKKARATSVCAAFQSRLLEISYLLRHKARTTSVCAAGPIRLRDFSSRYDLGIVSRPCARMN